MATNYGERIKELRLKNDWTQAILAEKLGKGTSTLRMWELGKNEPDIETLIKLSQIFKCSIDHIVCNEKSHLFIDTSREIRTMQQCMEILSSSDRLKALELLNVAFDKAFNKYISQEYSFTINLGKDKSE